MQVFKRSIWIARPRTEVFDYFIDFERPMSLYGWLAVPLLWLGRKRAYADQLPQLKRALEAAQ